MVPRIPCAILLPLLQLNKVNWTKSEDGRWTVFLACSVCDLTSASSRWRRRLHLVAWVVKFGNFWTCNWRIWHALYHSPLRAPDACAPPLVHIIITRLASDKGISDIPSLTLTKILATIYETLLQRMPHDRCAKNLDRSGTPNTWKENQ